VSDGRLLVRVGRDAGVLGRAFAVETAA